MKPLHLRVTQLLAFCQLLIQSTISEDDFNWCPEGYSGFVAGPGCISYIICSNGVQSGTGMPCQEGTLFNQDMSLCDFEENVQCDTTALPTQRPTRPPTVPPTPRIEPTTPSPTLPPNTRSPSSNVGVEDALDNAQHDINNKILLYESGFEGGWLPSTVYRYDTMLKALQLMYLEGVGDYRFYLGEDVLGVEGVKVGLVNLAAFLAQSMKETIKYNACDENNWDIIDNKYPLSNACGQLEQSYQDYVCPEGMEHMQCEVDPNMELKATTTAMWYGAPGPLFCGPKSKYPFTGYWDYGFQCDFPWKDPPEYCPDYPGQKGGRYDNSEPVENRNNRTDVEGCCWWGRGVIQTTGICNFGILNYYLGKKAADEGRDARYPDLDFCKDPGLICSREDHKELKWIAGFFYWMKSVQTYDSGWSYIDNLKAFVRGGMQDTSFIDAVSGIVNRGCHNPPCPNGSGMLDGGYERSENFSKVLEVLFEENGDPRIRRSTEPPTMFVTALDDSDTTTDNVSPTQSESLTESNFTADIITSDTEDASEELIEVEEDWSESAKLDEDASESDSSLIALGNDDEEEEDWSEIDGGGSSNSNLYCGENQRDATRNCRVEGNACPDGVCAENLKCYMVSNCGSGEDEMPVTDSPSPAPNSANTFNNESSTPTFSFNNESLIPTFGLLETDSPSTANKMPIESNDSEESTSGGFDIKNTFFCGVDRADAATSCTKRCPSGSPSDCPSEQSCFGYTPCPTEIEPDEPLTVADNTPSPISLPSGSSNNIGIQQNYCAKSLNDLQATCATAVTCNEGEPDCPSGTYCWGDRLCGEVPLYDDNSEPTPVPSLIIETQSPSVAFVDTGSPSEALVFTSSPVVHVVDSRAPVSLTREGLYCASTMDELKKSCSTAQECSSGPCPSGTFCFPFTCSSESTQQLYCATSVEELKTSCSTAKECNSGPCPSGTFCFPFECGASSEGNQPLDGPRPIPLPTGQPITSPLASTNNAAETLCPPTYTGWLSLDCIEYWECTDGLAGPITTCQEGLKFDKVISACNSADIVNKFCYGPPTTADTTADEQIRPDSNSAPEVENSNQEDALCKSGRSGWEAAPGCREYYWCDNGRMNDDLHDCGENLLFDSDLELCNFADQVVCKSIAIQGSQPEQSLPTKSPVATNQSSSYSNSTEEQDDKSWPASTTSPISLEVQDDKDEDLPPWLLNVVKESNSSSNSYMIHCSLIVMLIVTSTIHLDILW